MAFLLVKNCSVGDMGGMSLVLFVVVVLSLLTTYFVDVALVLGYGRTF
jgi:hypothetical protein